ncbi:MAG: SDR family NAD(P)-dependent oxidoreductase [Acidobacteriota bacterium]
MKIIVTGGAGFIGCNAVKRYLADGHEVVVLDNLSRRGAVENLKWLQGVGSFTFYNCDIRDQQQLGMIMREHSNAQVVLHLAAQVAVTTSVIDPRTDFHINALGTFNLLEAVREFLPEAILLYASTNKVYGGLEHLEVVERVGRYQYLDLSKGVSEAEPLDFHSPYGCSKGAADQYVRDYARIYGLRTICFRQSCIYGYRQFGVEDQGWVAWFTIAAVLGHPITIYGDGKQVRDVLFIDDLCDLYIAAVDHIERVRGQVYNIGGGAENQLSLLELIAQLEALTGDKIKYSFDKWRPGDQPVFVCDISKAAQDFNWRPRIYAPKGIELLYNWVKENREIF